VFSSSIYIYTILETVYSLEFSTVIYVNVYIIIIIYIYIYIYIIK